MGLDMYLFAVSKITADEEKKYCKSSIDDIYNDEIGVVRTGTLSESDAEKIGGIMPYLTKVTIIDSLVDVSRIKADNGVPDDAYIAGQIFCSRHTEYIFRNDDGFRKEVKIGDDELYGKYMLHPEREVYLFHKKQIHYWRKNYGLQEFIYNMLEEENGVDIQNCGYYPLSDEQIEKINGYLKDHPYESGRTGEIRERNAKDEAIVYWEWY